MRIDLPQRLGTAADRFPLTPAGLGVAALALLALFWFGYGSVDLILLVVGGLALVLVTVSALAVTLAATALWLGLDLKPHPERLELECGYAGRTGFQLRSSAWIPFVSVSWSWIEPVADVQIKETWGTQLEQITPRRRGDFEVIVRKIAVTDPFGLARVAFTVREKRTVRFNPSCGALKNLHVVQGLAGGDAHPHPEAPPHGDRFDMRRYAQGDPIRFVLWKVFARSRELVVRNPERAVAPVQETIAYLVCGNCDQAAAGAARTAIAEGALGANYRLGCDGSSELATTSSAAIDLIVRSASVGEADGGSGLDPFLSSGIAGSRRAVVFVPAVPGPWLERVAQAAARHATPTAPLEIVICTDGVLADTRRSLLARLALAPPPRSTRGLEVTKASQIRSVVAKLGRYPTHLILADRKTGRVFHRAQLRSLGI